MTPLLIFKLVVIVLIIRIIWLIIEHLVIVFWDKANTDVAAEIMKDPKAYVRNEHMCKFIYDMIWLYIFIRLLIGAFSSQITIN